MYTANGEKALSRKNPLLIALTHSLPESLWSSDKIYIAKHFNYPDNSEDKCNQHTGENKKRTEVYKRSSCRIDISQ